MLAGLDQTREFAEIDWQSVVNRIEELKAEQRELEAASAELARLDRELETVKKQITDAEDALREVDDQLGGLEHPGRAVPRTYCARRARSSPKPPREPARAHFAAIADLLAKAGQPRAGDRRRLRQGGDGGRHGDHCGLTAKRTDRLSPAVQQDRLPRWASSDASTRWRPAELDDSVESADGYRELHKRLTDDDLPRFQAAVQDVPEPEHDPGHRRLPVPAEQAGRA